MQEIGIKSENELMTNTILKYKPKTTIKETIKMVEKYYGTSKMRTTNKQLHKAGKKAFKELEKELK